jgi:uncharacterized protein (DUF488 family)
VGPARLFTIGHSTRSLEDFLGLLKREGVSHLADVRAFPTSARYPHFNGETLKVSLQANGIAYSHHPSLGGRRKVRRDSHNTLWRNASFRAYADYMETREFAHALDELIGIAKRETTAIMCAEAVPWRCHRSLIADAVLAAGLPVFDIMDKTSPAHSLTSFARIEDGRVHYDVAPQKDMFQPDSL